MPGAELGAWRARGNPSAPKLSRCRPAKSSARHVQTAELFYWLSPFPNPSCPNAACRLVYRGVACQRYKSVTAEHRLKGDRNAYEWI